eukprot:scaffold9278_cov170-Cylindrotheca_fusiformis.AAC.3
MTKSLAAFFRVLLLFLTLFTQSSASSVVAPVEDTAVEVVSDENKQGKEEKDDSNASMFLAGLVGGALAIPLALPLLGFTAGGVAAGSLAAGVQSSVYGAYTCGTFAVLQSAGTGAVASSAAVMAGGAAVGGVVGASVAKASGGGHPEEEEKTKD